MTSKKSFPIKILNFSLAIIFGLILLLALFNWNSYSNFQKNNLKRADFENLRDIIANLDSKLTSYVRLAVTSGDTSWENLYKKYGPELDSTIEELRRNSPNELILSGIKQIDSANDSLLNVESECFKLVRKNELEKAKELIFSTEYEQRKQDYKDGLQKVILGITQYSQKNAEQNRDEIFTEFFLIGISLIILMFVWWISLSLLKNYNKERAVIEKSLKESEETYRTLFESSSDGMFLLSDIFMDCNDAVSKLFNCKKEEIIGKTPLDFSPEFQPDGRSSKESATEKIKMARNGNSQRFYWQHKTSDNRLFDADVALNLIIINGEKLIQAAVRDITENKRLEKIQNALYKISEAAYTSTNMDSLYENIHKIVGTLMPVQNFYIALYDEKSDMITFPYMVDEFDPPYPPKKPGKGLTEYILSIGEARLIDAQLDLQLREQGLVEMVGTPTLIWLGVPLKIGRKTNGIIVVQDYHDEKTYGEEEKQLLIFVAEQITQAIERKRNAEEIKIYAEELNQLNKTKDKFFSIIAHDLKSPFHSLLGLSQLLTVQSDSLSTEEKEDYIQTLAGLLKNQYDLLQNLLEWGAMQMGKTEIKPTKLNLFSAVEEKILLLSENARRKNIEIENEILPDVYVDADRHLMSSVIQNFLANAIKFTNRNGKVKFCSQTTNSHVSITIEDNGVGISKEALKNIYSLDTVSSNKGTEGEAGTGLGIVLCKEMIEKQGGTLNITSEINKGTKVCFTVPLKKS